MSEEQTDQKLKQLEKEVAANKAQQPEKSDKPAPEKVTDKANSTNPQPRRAQQRTEPQPAKSGGLMTGLNFVLLVALAGAGGYGWWQNQQTLAQLKADLMQSQTTNQQLQQQNQSSQQQVAQLEQQFKQQTAQQHSLLEEFKVTEQHLAQVAGRRSQDWLLAEADYLVQMAGRKLWLEKDVDTAIAMLTAADQRIADLKDASLLPVREQITNDITRLSGLERISQPTLALSLNAIIQQVDLMPLKAIQLPDAVDTNTAPQVSSSASDWRQNLMIVWRDLVGSFITVTKRTGGTEPLMAPEQSWYLKENLKLKLLQGQQALLKGQQALYTQSLLQAVDWINQYYAPEDAVVIKQLEQLNHLALQTIQPNYPDTLSSINKLQDVMRQRAENLYSTGS